MNLVVLTSDPTAPNGPATTINSCSTNDTTWPCVHPNSLNKYFVQDNPASLPNICAVPGDTTTCVSFQYQQHFNNASLGTPTDPNCQAALALADSATWGSTTYTNFDDYSLDLAAYVRACSDLRIYDPSMANVYLYTNPFDSYTSFNAGRFVDIDDNPETDKVEVACMPMNFVEVRRLPPPGAPDPDFFDAASEHEMGHGFGLGHTCDSDMPNTVSDDSNIMQTTGENCCCESADAYHPSKEEWAHDTDDYFFDLCADCSTDLGLNAVQRTTCGDSTDDWNDPECGPMFSVGNRALAFNDSFDGYWSFDADDQVTTILNEAENMCACRCEEAVDDENKRIAVSNELPCHGGEGRFALLPLDWSDQNANGQGFSTLVPVMVSGGHLGRLSWITSATLVSAGSASRLAIPTVAHGWSFMGSDPDALNVTGLRVVDSAHPTLTIPVGEVGGAYLWGADDVDPLSEGFVPPVVDLHWLCNAPDYQASDVLWVHRPGGPYALKASLIGGAWNQDFLLRPDFDHNRLWVELRGFSRFSETIPISPNEDGSWSFSYSDSGFSIAGWLRSSGNPVGSSLQFHVNSASYGSWSTGNLNLPPLPRLP